jgi:hypothetical protein
LAKALALAPGLQRVWQKEFAMSDIAAASAASAASAPPSPAQSLWSKGGFGFKDLLDIVNPLQHLPVIGSVYRYLTGDEPSGGARLVGDALYGGPIGLGVGVVSSMLSDPEGHDIGEQALASVFGPHDGKPDTAKPTAIATATPTATTPAPTPAAPARPMSRSLASAAGPAGSTPATGGPVDIGGLYRSAPTAGGSVKTTPEQTFLSQNAQFQQQIANGRAPNGMVITPKPVPLELPGNLQSQLRSPVRPAAAQAGQTATQTPPDPNTPVPISQKMLEALDKYSQMKKQQDQQDSSAPPAADKVDLSL